MELTNEFEVHAPVERAWAVLTDLERIAPCMPGAQLQEVEGDEHRGIVKIKVGPITAQFKGAARFVERDADAHRAVLRAEGRDTTGKGNAAATITAQLEPRGDSTHVSVVTDLHITGRVAQFGRGALADVSSKLLAQFVTQLESTVLAGEPEAAPADPEAGVEAGPVAEEPAEATAAAEEPATGAAAQVAADEPVATAGAATAPDAGVRHIDSPEPVPVNVVSAAGMPALKRLLPVLGTLGLVLVLRRWRRRRS